MKTKMQSSVLLVIALVLLLPLRGAAADLRLGVDTIVPRQVYVVYSGLSANGQLANVSNIYVIRGMATANGTVVWIFSAGYGDQNGDVRIYRGPSTDCTRNAIDDARDVDSLITAGFGLPRAQVNVNFIAPHFHLDHINQEFFTALFDSLKYSLATDTRGCALPADLTRLPSHGNLETTVGVAPAPVRHFGLEQNYPNPFNPSTVISFHLSVNSHVTLKVFDVNGREMATLVDENLATGYHAVTFAPNHTASGLYFYKITAGKFSQMRKAVLMK